MRKANATSVDEYLNLLEEPVRSALENLRLAIRKAAPEAEEVISYQIPTYKLNGALVHFAAFTNHCSFFVVNKAIIEKYKVELEAYRASGTTIQFLPEKPLPASLVLKIVKERMKQNTNGIMHRKKSRVN